MRVTPRAGVWQFKHLHGVRLNLSTATMTTEASTTKASGDFDLGDNVFTPGVIAGVVVGSVALLVLLSISLWYMLFQKHCLDAAGNRCSAKFFMWTCMCFTACNQRCARKGWWQEVDDRVYVGGVPLKCLGHPRKLFALGIRGVVNTMDEYNGPLDEYESFGIDQLHLPVIDHFEPSLDQNVRAVEFIQRILDSGGSVLIHCKGGHGRSAAIAFAWLLKKRQMSLEEAQVHILSRRAVRKKLFRQPELIRFHRRFVLGLEDDPDAAADDGAHGCCGRCKKRKKKDKSKSKTSNNTKASSSNRSESADGAGDLEVETTGSGGNHGNSSSPDDDEAEDPRNTSPRKRSSVVPVGAATTTTTTTAGSGGATSAQTTSQADGGARRTTDGDAEARPASSPRKRSSVVPTSVSTAPASSSSGGGGADADDGDGAPRHSPHKRSVVAPAPSGNSEDNNNRETLESPKNWDTASPDISPRRNAQVAPSGKSSTGSSSSRD